MADKGPKTTAGALRRRPLAGAVTGLLLATSLIGACSSENRSTATGQVRVFGSAGDRYTYDLSYITPKVFNAPKVTVPPPRPGLPSAEVLPPMTTAFKGDTKLPWVSQEVNLPKGTQLYFSVSLDAPNSSATPPASFRCELYSKGHLISQHTDRVTVMHGDPPIGGHPTTTYSWSAECDGNA